MKLPELVKKQKEVLGLPKRGHFIILGTAGSGKTTLAIYRALYLSKDVDENQKVLLLTYNKSLVNYFNFIVEDQIMNNIDIHNYHKFARGYLSNKGVLDNRDIISSKKKKELINEAISIVKKNEGDNVTLSRNIEIFVEEINWIQKLGIISEDNYIKEIRVGRKSVRIIRSNRKYFYLVYKEYLKIREEQGYKFDWEDIALEVIKQFGKDSSKRLYKHIIIDEGQDFSPIMLKSLISSTPSDGSISFFGDVAQQIYGSRISWRSAGFKDTKKIWKFNQNFRNSVEIARFAKSIDIRISNQNIEDIVEPELPKASGPKPLLYKLRDSEKELEEIKRISKLFLENGKSVVIIFDTNNKIKYYKKKFELAKIPVIKIDGYLNKFNIKKAVYLSTFHSVKGLEFDSVIIPHFNNDRIPREDQIKKYGSKDKARDEFSKLFYVGVTRAKNNLIITYTKELSEIVPTNQDLFNQKIKE